MPKEGTSSGRGAGRFAGLCQEVSVCYSVRGTPSAVCMCCFPKGTHQCCVLVVSKIQALQTIMFILSRAHMCFAAGCQVQIYDDEHCNQ